MNTETMTEYLKALESPTKSRQANRLLHDFSYIPFTGLTAECIVSLMRYYHVTIRHLSGSMGVTQKRVREVRNEGIPLDLRDSARTVLLVKDWIEGIEGAALTAPCSGGCSLWRCARPRNHRGPCQPDYEGGKR